MLEAMRRLGPLGVVILVFSWLPFLALAAIGVWILGARVLIVPAAFALVLWIVRRDALTRPRRPFLQVVAVSLMLATAGGVAFGGLGFMFGLAMGAAYGLGSAYELELKNRDGVAAPLDSRDPVQQATLGKVIVFLSAAPMLVVLAGLIWFAVNR
jgi:hypothetical protein